MNPSPNVIQIESIQDPRVSAYANLRDRQLAADAGCGPQRRPEYANGLFIAEGELVLHHLLASAFRIHSVLLTPARLETLHGALNSLPADAAVYLVSQQVMNDIVGFNIHRGVLAAAFRGDEPNPKDLIAQAPAAVVLEDLTNLDNVGGIFRVVSALAPVGTCVLLSPRCCDPLYRKSIRVSMGHALRVPFARLEPWPEAVSTLRDAGFAVVGMAVGAGAVSVREAESTLAGRRPAIVLGSEGPGLSDGLLGMADVLVRIPMRTGVDSLNVVTASAVAMSWLLRL